MPAVDSTRTLAMKEEVSAAVMFLIRLIGKSENLSNGKLDELKKCLTSILMKRFQDHWFPDKPFKGQAYRCIRINETERRDPILQQAADECGLNYDDFKLPTELTIWVDPEEVCCRFGEFKGSYCIVASFKDGNKENFVDQINVDELEQKAQEKARQATFEIMSGHRGWKKKSLGSRLRNGYSNHNNHLYHPLQLHNIQHPSYPYPPLSTQYQPPQQLSPVYSTSPSSHFFYSSSSPPHHSQAQPVYATTSGGHLALTPPHMTTYRSYGGKGFTRGSGNHFPNGYERSSPSYPNFTTTITNGPVQSGMKNDRYHWMNKSTVKA